MKRIIAVLMCIIFAFLCTSCGNETQKKPSETEMSNIAETENTTQESSTELPETEISNIAETENTAQESSTELSEIETSNIADTTNSSQTITTTEQTIHTIEYPLVNRDSNGNELTLNEDGTFKHNGVNTLDIGQISDSYAGVVLHVDVTTSGKYTVRNGEFTFSDVKVIMSMPDSEINKYSGIVKFVIKQLNGSELTNKSTAVVSDGVLTVNIIASNGTDDYCVGNHIFTAEETAAILKV